jgi:hypothetical protein
MPRGRPKKQEAAQGPGNNVPKLRSGRTNKMECVRQVLHEFGNKTPPKQIQEHLKSKFGLSMDTKMISTYKGSILKSGRMSGVMRRPGARPAARAAGHNGGLSVNDIRAVRELVGRIGADNVRELTAMFSR